MRAVRICVYLVVCLLLSVQAGLAISALYLKRTDQQLLIIVGGSMEPQYSVGDALILNTDPDQVNVGDIVTFHDGSTLTTHRVVSERTIDGDRYLQTQGDANDTPDPDLAPIDAVVGVPVHHIPDGGHAVIFLTSRNGRLLTIGPALLLVIVIELSYALRRRDDPDADPDDDAESDTDAAGAGPDPGNGEAADDSRPPSGGRHRAPRPAG